MKAPLSKSEQARFARIQREVRYALRLADQKWLVRLVEKLLKGTKSA